MKILVWGGRSKARILLAMINDIYGSQTEVTGIFDKTLTEIPFETNHQLYTSQSDLPWLIKQSSHYVVCIGDNHGYARYMTAMQLEKRGLLPISLISEHAVLDDLESAGNGLQAMPGAIAHKFTRLGEQCILNTNSTIDHECTIGNGVHVMGSASIAGRITIGNFSTVGTNATILPNLTIGNNVYIGAGSVVTKDVEDGVVVAGVPCKYLKQHTPRFDPGAFDEQ